MTSTGNATSTCKVRRTFLGGKRPEGLQRQREGRRVERPRAASIKVATSAERLSALGGLVGFNHFIEKRGVGGDLRRAVSHLKTGPRVVYPMEGTVRILMDLIAAGGTRVFALENSAADPVFRVLAGGEVPSVDTVYDDLRRFATDSREELQALEDLVTKVALRSARDAGLEELTIDVDTTVVPLFGEQEGAEIGFNPKYPGRPSYHPILARIAELDAVIGARLRPGDTTLGWFDCADIRGWLAHIKTALPEATVRVRIDAGGDCADLMKEIDQAGALFVIKARATRDLIGAALACERWATVDEDADGLPTRQVAELPFARGDWPTGRYRVIAVRANDRRCGHQLALWENLDHCAQFFVTNDLVSDADDLARSYDGRAGIEPLIAELKGCLGFGKSCSDSFCANEALLLLKALVHNLLVAYGAQLLDVGTRLRTPWLRAVLIAIPAKVTRSARRWKVHLARPPWHYQLN